MDAFESELDPCRYLLPDGCKDLREFQSPRLQAGAGAGFDALWASEAGPNFPKGQPSVITLPDAMTMFELAAALHVRFSDLRIAFWRRAELFDYRRLISFDLAKQICARCGVTALRAL